MAGSVDDVAGVRDRLDDLDFSIESPWFGRLDRLQLTVVAAVAHLALAGLAAAWTDDILTTSYWPAAGVGIGIALHVDRSKRPLVLIAILIATGVDAVLIERLGARETTVLLVAAAVGFGVAMVVIQWVFAHGRLSFDDRSIVVVAAMFLAAAVSGVIVVVGWPTGAGWTTWRTWTLGVGLGYASIGGVIMTFHRPNAAGARAQATSDPRRLAVALTITIALGAIAFSTSGPAVFLLFAPVLMLSVRFGTWVSGPISVAAIVFANVQTSRGVGPFGDLPDGTLHLQVFGAVLLFTSLLVGRHDWHELSRARREQAVLAVVPDEVTSHRLDGTLVGHLATAALDDPSSLEALLEQWPTAAETLLPTSFVYTVDGDPVRHIEARFVRADEGTVICLRRDVSEEYELVRQLARAKEHWQRLASTAFEGFVEIDRWRCVVYASDRWVEMHGFGSDEVVGRPIGDLLDPVAAAHFDRPGAPAGSSTTFEYRHVRSDGAEMWALVSLDADADAHGFAGAVAFVADTTELHTALARRDVAELRLATLERRERERIARFLHDGPLQTMVAVSYRLNGVRAGGWAGTDAAQLERMCLDAIDSMRSGLAELTLTDVRDGRIGAALEAAASRFGAHDDLHIEVTDATLGPVDPDVAGTLYLIGREALVNAILHARARTIVVSVTEDATGFGLVVQDDGVGFGHDGAAGPGHLGVRSMRQRALDLGGACEVTSSRVAGTRVSVSIPRPPTAERVPDGGRPSEMAP